MKESQLCTEIVKSLRGAGAWAYKIPDASPMLRTVERFIPARAFDIIATHQGLAVAIEVKLLKTLGGLSPEKITSFEMDSLMGVEVAGGAGVLAVGYVCDPSDAQRKKDGCIGSRVRELYFLWAADWAHLIRFTDGRPLRRDIIKSVGIRVPWVGKGVWDCNEGLRELHRRAANGGNAPGVGACHWRCARKHQGRDAAAAPGDGGDSDGGEPGGGFGGDKGDD